MGRELEFTYAGLVIGKGQTDSSYNLTDKYTFSKEYGKASLSFDVVVQSPTRATFLTSEAALIAAYRKPDQVLVVVLEATDREKFDPSDNSGFNLRARCEKLGSEEDTANSSRWRCTVTVELPADLTGRSGRLTSQVDVQTDPAGIRTLQITGTYTALSSNEARAQFEASILTYATALILGLGSTIASWDLIGTPTAVSDDQDKFITFSRVYQELVFNQAIGVLNSANLVGETLKVQVSRQSADALGRVQTPRPTSESLKA